MKHQLSKLSIRYTYLSEEFHFKYYDLFLSKFPYEIRSTISKFRRWQDAQASLLGKCMIVHVILNGDYDKFKLIKYNQFKKPALEKSNFNISHAGSIVVLVSWENQIGIDVELIREIDISDFKIQMTTLEWDRVQQEVDVFTSFFNYWTQKESVVKAIGKGMSIPFRSFEIINNSTFVEGEKYYVKEIVIDKNYVCTIASPVDLDHVVQDIKKLDFIL